MSAIRRSSLQPSPALPDLNRIAHVATIRGLAPVLIVPEVLETLEHYRDKLGFESREWEPNPAAYGYARRDECHIHFNQGEQARPNSEVVQPDLFDVYLWVDDVAALHEEPWAAARISSTSRSSGRGDAGDPRPGPQRLHPRVRPANIGVGTPRLWPVKGRWWADH